MYRHTQGASINTVMRTLTRSGGCSAKQSEAVVECPVREQVDEVDVNGKDRRTKRADDEEEGWKDAEWGR